MAVVPAGTIEDYHGVGISGDLAADLAEVVVHDGGIADRHHQRRDHARRRADRTKQIGRGEAEIFWRHRPAAGLPPYPGQAVLLANASLVLKPYLDSRTGRLHRLDSLSGKEAFGSLIARNRAPRTPAVIADLEPYPSALLAETPRPFRRC